MKSESNIFSPLRLNINKVERVTCRNEIIADKCKGKNVLHIGCTDWPITHHRIKENTLLHKKIADAAHSCIGIDISEEGLSALKKKGFDVRHGDAEKLDKNFAEATFDVVVIGEVLEHLNNPGLCLKKVFQVLKSTGEIVVTVPNAFYILNFFSLLFRREITHRDHAFYFSAKTLNCLLGRYDFDISYLGYTFPMPKTVLRKIRIFPLYLLFTAVPFFGLSIVMIAQKKTVNKNTNKIVILR